MREVNQRTEGTAQCSIREQSTTTFGFFPHCGIIRDHSDRMMEGPIYQATLQQRKRIGTQ